MMEWLLDPGIWIALLTLTALEIVLGIDNIVFITILVSKLPANQRGKARTIGLGLALVSRLALLLAISWVIGLTASLFEIFEQEISGRDLILMGGGLFLLGKATFEIHEKLEGHASEATATAASFGSIIAQIIVLDMVFSLDSVITAVGVMLVSARAIGEFVDRHPTVKILALSFLLLIGMVLVAESLDQHIPKGYIYFAMGFAVFVEMLNLRMRAEGEDEGPAVLRQERINETVLSRVSRGAGRSAD